MKSTKSSDKSAEPPESISQPFTSQFREDVRWLIALGLDGARTNISTDHEEEITGHLYHSIDRLLSLSSEPWLINYSVKNEVPISGGSHAGKNRRRIDLLIELTGIVPRPVYAFEAKPLDWNKAHKRISHYTSDTDGMGRFVNEGDYARYTASYPEVGMLGYVLSDTPEKWQERLMKAIEDRRETLRLIASQREVTVSDAFPLEWISEHDRDTSVHSIAIYHLLLDCSC